MKQLFFSFLFILISCATYAENNCNCPNSSQKIKQIQDDIDKKQFELIPERIDRLPIKDLSCKQYA